MGWMIVVMLLVTQPASPELHAVWQGDQVMVSWQSDIPACVAVWKPGTGEHLLPETCQTTHWTLSPGGGDYAYTVDQATALRLIANDGNPRVLTTLLVPLQPRRWLPIVTR